ncbi:MAG: hypothetical protein KA270_01850 [Saprospiraceae bacterium]|nr:hypothetical protein [Saprospiraceae bacterium]MBP6565877.1 hypothetical protein [Saprospiraceae bacterium]
MKTFLIILTAFLFLNINLFAQFSHNIDPRQYLTLKYAKNSNDIYIDTIWNWENNPNIPFQKYKYIDVEGSIQIHFNINSLILNNKFEGIISLEAEISGNSGTRKIEVNPYSEIGVQRKPIGIRSEAPTEIAKKILNMLIQINDATNNYQLISESYVHFISPTMLKYIQDEINQSISRVKKDPSINDQEEWNRLFDKILYLNKFVLTGNYWDGLDGDYERKAIQLLLEIERQYNVAKFKYLDASIKSLIYSKSKSELVLSYLIAIEKAGPDALNGFLTLINKDKIGFDQLKKELIGKIDKIGIIEFNKNTTDENKMKLILDNEEEIIGIAKYLSDLSNLKGSFIESTLAYLRGNTTTLKSDFDDLYYDINNLIEEIKKRGYQIDDKLSDEELLKKYFNEISNFLTIKAGAEIYKKFVFATIDLGKSGAKENEVLNVYINWILEGQSDSVSTAPRLPIGKFFLRETGWKMEVSDMFALVKRLKEPSLMAQNLSPSNFKGSGGVVLNWTYQKKDRGLKITDNKIKKRNKFMNFLEPSVGLNVSYLDFSTEKDVEIGIGSQLGLFRNKIYLGYGTNIHMYSPIKESPNYFYIGFSFANLTTLFKGK